jgi:hypothetical protein
MFDAMMAEGPEFMAMPRVDAQEMAIPPKIGKPIS